MSNDEKTIEELIKDIESGDFMECSGPNWLEYKEYLTNNERLKNENKIMRALISSVKDHIEALERASRMQREMLLRVNKEKNLYKKKLIEASKYTKIAKEKIRLLKEQLNSLDTD